MRLTALGDTRPDGQIAAEVAGLKQDRRWRASQGCETTTTPASREFCAAIYSLEAERAKAKAAADLRNQIERVRAEMTRARAVGAGEDKDPQAGLLARLSGLDLTEAQQALSVLMAVLVEIGAAATLYLAAGVCAPARRAQPSIGPAIESPPPCVQLQPQEEERFRLPDSGRILLFAQEEN